jgi:hypothetical protein
MRFMRALPEYAFVAGHTTAIGKECSVAPEASVAVSHLVKGPSVAGQQDVDASELPVHSHATISARNCKRSTGWFFRNVTIYEHVALPETTVTPSTVAMNRNCLL